MQAESKSKGALVSIMLWMQFNSNKSLKTITIQKVYIWKGYKHKVDRRNEKNHTHNFHGMQTKKDQIKSFI